MKSPSKTILIAVIVLCSIASSYAWLRRHFSDEEVVDRARYIVVGKIRDGTLALVNHDGSHEYHVNLMISEVLKGQISSNSLIVSIHYGLEPKVSSSGAVEIQDNSGSASIWLVASDIRTNHIWLLHQELNPNLDNSDWIGIYDPEDIQPIRKKNELLKYLK
jgi:hypothetical protein